MVSTLRPRKREPTDDGLPSSLQQEPEPDRRDPSYGPAGPCAGPRPCEPAAPPPPSETQPPPTPEEEREKAFDNYLADWLETARKAEKGEDIIEYPLIGNAPPMVRFCPPEAREALWAPYKARVPARRPTDLPPFNPPPLTQDASTSPHAPQGGSAGGGAVATGSRPSAAEPPADPQGGPPPSEDEDICERPPGYASLRAMEEGRRARRRRTANRSRG